MPKIVCVAGARPNFPKVAPLLRALAAYPDLQVVLVHTGQHYDDELSQVFFADLDLPAPDHALQVGSASHAVLTAELIKRFEAVLAQEQPQGVIVVGDVDSTLACALATSKFALDRPYSSQWGERLRPALFHVEAGLRSFEAQMPEEINRRLTDSLADLLFVTEPSAVTNLQREGLAAERIAFVGNVMIDTLIALREQAQASEMLARLGLSDKRYALLTLHRPSNVDHPASLRALISVLDEIAADQPLVFPLHPRTRQRWAEVAEVVTPDRWHLCPPLGYIDFLRLMTSARLVLTDSGGIQEETTALGVPCLTLRQTTERPVTVAMGTNRLAGTTRATILAAYREIQQHPPQGRLPELWDGQAAGRIAAMVARALAVKN